MGEVELFHPTLSLLPPPAVGLTPWVSQEIKEKSGNDMIHTEDVVGTRPSGGEQQSQFRPHWSKGSHTHITHAHGQAHTAEQTCTGRPLTVPSKVASTMNSPRGPDYAGHGAGTRSAATMASQVRHKARGPA